MPHVFETAHLTVGQQGRGQDRVAVLRQADRTVIVVADGAGGIGSGDLASAAVVREVEAKFPHVANAEQWATTLRQIDVQLGVGESTAVVVELQPDAVFGASVGDSRAWIVHDGELVDLTINQQRKPLLGSGDANPVTFTHGPLLCTLIVATDGFTNYVKRDQLTRLVAQTNFLELPRRCVELVRLPSGELWDDIGIVVCRQHRPERPRKRYVL